MFVPRESALGKDQLLFVVFLFGFVFTIMFTKSCPIFKGTKEVGSRHLVWVGARRDAFEEYCACWK